ncbi:nicotinate-nucleotide adenylyltransferase [Xylophilus sp. GW821-FHT01B05]
MGVKLAAAARRIGVFGGAFDPPHRAHVALVRAALEQLQLDVMHVLPTGHAWHKTRPLSAAEDRLAMTRIAFEGEPRVLVDPRELHRDGPTYTIDTLHELAAENPGAELYLLLGADQASALDQWHDWEAILRIAIISIAERQGAAMAKARFDPEKLSFARVRHLELPAMDVSATEVRARAADGRGIGRLVPAGVARYIELHHLYRTA